MWEGPITDELRELAFKYMEENDGIPPDMYDELNYDAMTYERFVKYIREALDKHVCITEVVPIF